MTKRWFAVDVPVRAVGVTYLSLQFLHLLLVCSSTANDYNDQTVRLEASTGDHILYGLYGGQRESPFGNPKIQNIYIPDDDVDPAASTNERWSSWEPSEPTESDWNDIQDVDTSALDSYRGENVGYNFLSHDDNDDDDDPNFDNDAIFDGDSEPRSFLSWSEEISEPNAAVQVIDLNNNQGNLKLVTIGGSGNVIKKN